MPDAGLRPEVRDNGGLRVYLVGGTPSNAGGLEAFCARAADALNTYARSSTVTLMPANTAYWGPRSAIGVIRTARVLVRDRARIGLIWLQVSNFADLGYLVVARICRIPVLVTPHYGANSRLQTVSPVRLVSRLLLGKANAVGMLFAQQGQEIELPNDVARSLAGTFLPEAAVTGDPPSQSRDRAPLRVMHAARFSAGKGTFDMIALCARLRERGMAFEAQLVGRADAETMGQIRAAIARHGLESHVSLTEWLDEDAMQAALRNADVLVHLSRLDSFPLIVLEALAADTLPIVRPMIGSRSIVSDFAGYVAERDDAVQDACEWLCSQPLAALRETARVAGVQVRKAYGWPRLVERLEAIFSSTCDQAAKA